MKANYATLAAVTIFATACSNTSIRPEFPNHDPAASQDITGSIALLKSRIASYRTKWQALDSRQWQSAEVVAEGGGVTALGMLGRSTPIAGLGALVSGTVLASDKFYGTDKQDEAWSHGYRALRCILANTLPFDHQTPALSLIQAPDNSARTSEQYLSSQINQGVDRIQEKLEDRLRFRAINTAPDWSAFESAVRSAVQRASAPTSKDAKLKKGTNTLTATRKINGTDTEVEIPGDHVAALAKAIGRFADDLTACHAAN